MKPDETVVSELEVSSHKRAAHCSLLLSCCFFKKLVINRHWAIDIPCPNYLPVLIRNEPKTRTSHLCTILNHQAVKGSSLIFLTLKTTRHLSPMQMGLNQSAHERNLLVTGRNNDEISSRPVIEITGNHNLTYLALLQSFVQYIVVGGIQKKILLDQA